MQNTTVLLRDRETLAYNTSGVPYDHQIDKAFQGCIIRVRSVTSHFLNEDEHFQSRTLLKPNEKEVESQEGTRCMWIGMQPKVAKDYGPGKVQGRAGAPKKGESIRDGKTTLLIQHDPFALRVVVVVGHGQNKMFALVNEQNKLCEGVRVSLDNVFLFSLFRDDDLGAKEKRAEAWSRKITDLKAKTFKRPVVRQKTARDDARITVNVKRNFANKLRGLVATYMRDPRPTYLEMIQSAIENEDQDLKHQPMGGTAIMSLVDGKKRITKEQAQSLIDEITIMWAGLRELEIKPDEVMSLARGLEQGAITLEYGLIRPYFVDWVRSIRKGEGKEEDLGHLAKETHRYARMACDTAAPAPSVAIADNDFLVFLDTTIENLRAVEIYGHDYAAAAAVSLGDCYSGESLPEIFERFADTPDMEGAQHWMKEACHYLVGEMIHRDKGVIEHLQVLTGELEKLRAALSEKIKDDEGEQGLEEEKNDDEMDDE